MQQEIRDKFIQEVFGENKVRDYSIIEFHALYPERDASELIKDLALDISEARISQILTVNQDLIFKVFVQINPLMLKEGRAFEIIRSYRSRLKRGINTLKDPIEILEQLRKEVVGEKGVDVKVGVNVQTKTGSNGFFTGEDRELTDRLKRSWFGEVPQK